MTDGWISVRNWRHFQHYDPAKRQPRWLKLYTELLSDDAWLELSGNDRAVLVCLWLEYASSRCRLRADTRSLSRQLSLRVTSATLDRLVHAGFIDIVASKLLADGYQSASPEVEREVEEETPLPSSNVNVPAEEPEGRWPTEAELADLNRDEFGVPVGILKDIPA